GTKVDGLLRHAHLDGLATADVRAAIDPGHDQDLDRPLQEAIEDFARIRRRTVDLLHGWGKSEWERIITDPRGGNVTLLDICQMVTRHEMAHIAQIRNLSVLLPEPLDLGPRRPAPGTPPDHVEAWPPPPQGGRRPVRVLRLDLPAPPQFFPW